MNGQRPNIMRKHHDKKDEVEDELDIEYQMPRTRAALRHPKAAENGHTSSIIRSRTDSKVNSIATGVINKDERVSIDDDDFEEDEKDDTNATSNKKVSFSEFNDIDNDVGSDGNNDRLNRASSNLDDGVMNKLDEFIESYQTMKRRKKLESFRG